MALKYVMRCVNESMRLYPHPPVLLRRALVEDELPGEWVHTAWAPDFLVCCAVPACLVRLPCAVHCLPACLPDCAACNAPHKRRRRCLF